MNVLRASLLAACVCVSSLAMAAESATTPAVVIAKGKQGQAPVQVVYDYLLDRVANEYGIGEYQRLNIQQQSPSAEEFNQVNLTLTKEGLLDDSVATQRYRFVLNFEPQAGVWLINSVTQDWQCRRGNKKAWTQKPCR
ncbi:MULTISPECIES: hypothetical protein [Chitinibacter]|uniref:hypothetical protein n=1 Tax=Chitinibacter TaxID=230666 RepID=UPI0012E031D8|nr:MULTISPECIES: hypothetical protein [Chitinibacter]